jgi:hypothetical protein
VPPTEKSADVASLLAVDASLSNYFMIFLIARAIFTSIIDSDRLFPWEIQQHFSFFAAEKSIR